MFGKAIVRGLLAVAMVASCAVVARADVFKMTGGQTSLQFVTVGNPGNAADPPTGYGSVANTYQMGKYDVTVGQYVQFLNAVAKTDTYGLYNSDMATDYQTIGITQSGSSGSYSYAVSGSYGQAANCPVFDVSWGDAARFSNWLQNGQPTSGVENAGTTENGAYTLNGAISNSALMAVTRNAGATYFIPSEDEWYKAAYYDPNKPGGAGYWLYPTKSNTAPGNTLPDAGNSANYFVAEFTDSTDYLTPVGEFSNSPGAYGTFDMGGDICQWNEGNIAGSSRGLRGGSWCDDSYILVSSHRNDLNPVYGSLGVGFRVASVPEPASLVMVVSGAIAALVWWRRCK